MTALFIVKYFIFHQQEMFYVLEMILHLLVIYVVVYPAEPCSLLKNFSRRRIVMLGKIKLCIITSYKHTHTYIRTVIHSSLKCVFALIVKHQLCDLYFCHYNRLA